MDLQFYPTSPRTAIKAWNKIKTPIRRLLEPSAGRGDLLIAMRPHKGLDDDTLREFGFSDSDIYRCRKWGEMPRRKDTPIDVCEINFDHHPTLREKGFRVVGHDFLDYAGAASYSHILMNPPFSQGAEHVLHGWDMLYSGELVAILNAETLRNPCTKKRQLLAHIVEQFSASEPEYLTDAFMDPDTQRKTEVEIVIIHLEKVSKFKADFINNLADEVRKKHAEEDYARPNALMLPGSFIQNKVIAFECAVEALKQSCIASARSGYYASMLGYSILDNTTNRDNPEAEAASAFNSGYDNLKERAWSSILRSTDVTSRLSSGAQKRLEADFKQICDLEFTVKNIYAFLDGLIGQQGEIQIEMCCDVFDAISKYHPENRAYYQGWKSNAKHRVNAFRIQTTRVVLPASRRDWYDGYTRSLNWDDTQRFRDFDKVFALLDGKHHESTFGLVALFDRKMADMKSGERCSCDYFDVRFYPRAGTFHLFPRRKDLVEKLNRLVGKHRQWLPQSDKAASEGFWQQYKQAEKVTKRMDLRHVDMWYLANGEDGEKQRQADKLFAAHMAALGQMDIEFDPNNALVAPDVPDASNEQLQLPLLALAS